MEASVQRGEFTRGTSVLQRPSVRHELSARWEYEGTSYDPTPSSFSSGLMGNILSNPPGSEASHLPGHLRGGAVGVYRGGTANETTESRMDGTATVSMSIDCPHCEAPVAARFSALALSGSVPRDTETCGSCGRTFVVRATIDVWTEDVSAATTRQPGDSHQA